MFSLSIIIFSIACGGSEEQDLTTEDGGVLKSRIINPDNTHSVSDFEIAGLKKPKSLQADAIDKKTGEPITPGAKEIYLGFYKSSLGPKDVEIRIYESHDEALTYGVPSAEKTISTVVALIFSVLTILDKTSNLSSGTVITPIFGSIVQKGEFADCAFAVDKQLNNVDFPTLGKPTIPHFKDIILIF